MISHLITQWLLTSKLHFTQKRSSQKLKNDASIYAVNFFQKSGTFSFIKSANLKKLTFLIIRKLVFIIKDLSSSLFTIDFVRSCERSWRFPRRSYLIQSCRWPSRWTGRWFYVVIFTRAISFATILDKGLFHIVNVILT